MNAVGRSVPRKEAVEKVTGTARYNADFLMPGILRAHLVASPHAHARITSIDTSRALRMPGVRAVVTGRDTSMTCGEVIEDRPPLARDRVRYWGEPVAVVVADSEAEAMAAASAVEVHYQALPAVNSVRDALATDAPLVHEKLGDYRIAQQPVFPEEGTNVADRAKVRKGDIERGWGQSEVRVEAHCSLPQLDHAAMETRSALAEVLPNGRILIHSTSQAPFEVQKTLARYFQVAQGEVLVNVPLVGGAFGGKAAVQLEVLALLASRAVGGRPVKLVNTREQDIAGSPVAMGLEGTVRLGATREGRIVAAEMDLHMDIGAYCDSAPRMARAMASECTGPYDVQNVRCDVLCVYTNHVYTTAYRGFGHMQAAFAVERAVERLADALGTDPLELRRRNAIGPGQRTPTQVRLTANTVGDLRRCLDRVRDLIDWDEGRRVASGRDRVRAKGVSAVWKTSSSPPDATSGAIVTFNKDGGVNLSIGAVECGPGSKTAAAQMLADALGIDVDRVHVHMEVNTQVDPEHWKTVASMSTFMVGRAVLEAAEDAKRQLRGTAASVLRCPESDLSVGGARVYLTDDPSLYLAFRDIAHGYSHRGGDAIGHQVIGRGGFVMRHLTPLDRETGRGMPGPTWTVGAQAVEVELDLRRYTYRILRAATAIDAGRVINPALARGAVVGGTCMGLGYGSRECLLYGGDGQVRNNQLRMYKMMRLGEQPDYLVEFVETPQTGAPYGARPVGEHGVLGAPAALAAALSAAAGVQFDALPITPERIWRAARAAREAAV